MSDAAAEVERSIWRLAGFIGVDPHQFTLRELFLIGLGRKAESDE